MSRRRAAEKRDILPDPLYKSKRLAKFINVLMKDGKKAKAERIVYDSLQRVVEFVKKNPPKQFQASSSQKSADESGAAIARAGHTSTCSIARALALSKFEEALMIVTPKVEVKSRRVGGSTFQVPVEINTVRQQALAMRWLIDSARKRSEKDMTSKLSAEIIAALSKQGGAYKKKEDTHKMADANKAFAHYFRG
jgi:small subunit ribosomal protein S7